MKWLAGIVVVMVGCGGAPADNGPAVGDGDASSDTGANTDAVGDLVHYVGRFTDDHSFEWSGSAVVARFSGTGVQVTITGSPNTFATFIDGEPAETFDAPVYDYPIATRLTDGEHSVEVYRRTEALFGENTFGGFTVTDGGLVLSVSPFEHRLQFIGDSISCGYGDLGTNGTCHLELTTESELVAYGGLTARALNAAHHVIAWSGKGMYRQYGDSDVPSPEQMPELYERAIPTDASSTWDHASYIPEVIVINLGTNDWSGGDPGEPYETAYVNFLTHLRSLYPDAHIFCSLGPMQNAEAALLHVQNVVTTMNDARIYYLEFAAQLESDGLGCDYHPSQTTHQIMATTLEQAIRAATGW